MSRYSRSGFLLIALALPGLPHAQRSASRPRASEGAGEEARAAALAAPYSFAHGRQELRRRGDAASGPGGETSSSLRAACVDALRDRAMPSDCIPASSAPVLGMLYPLSTFLFVAPTGQLVVNGLTPVLDARMSVFPSNGEFGLDIVGTTAGPVSQGLRAKGGSVPLPEFGNGGTGIWAEGGFSYFEAGGTALFAKGGSGTHGGPGIVALGGRGDEGYGVHASAIVAVSPSSAYNYGVPAIQALSGGGYAAAVYAKGGSGPFTMGIEGYAPGPSGTGVLGRGSIGVRARSTTGATALYSEGDTRTGTATTGHRLVVESTDDNTVRLIGPMANGYGARLNFGNADEVYLYEDPDDVLEIHASETRITSAAVGVNMAATPSFTLEVNGTAGKPGGGSWSVASDERLKKNVRAIDGALDELLALRGVSFEYRDPEAIQELPGERIGFIAQEVEEVFPDWVDEGPDGTKRTTIRGFEALAVEALRELREENRELRRANDELRRRVEKLEQAGR